MKKITLLLSFLLLVVGINAQNPGDFDSSFGTDGIVMTAIGDNYAEASDITVQPDGKIIVVGEARWGSKNFTLVRYNTDGSLDAGFGENGIVHTAINDAAFGISVVLQADGRIVLTGLAQNGSSYFGEVARYNVDGSLDNSFGTNGISHLTIANTASVVIQEDGKIVVGGFDDDNFAMARLNTNGSLDNTFGNAGYVITHMTDPDGSSNLSYILDLALQTDGKIVATGFSQSFTTFHDVAVARYNTNGTLDITFADAGIFKADLGGLADFGTSVAIQDDGKIVIGGHKEFAMVTGIPEYDAAIIRLNTDGSYDEAFGENGVAYFRLTEQATYVNDVVMQADGSIIFTGQTVNYSASIFDIYVARIKPDGSLDISFGDEGVKHMDLFGTDDYAESLTIQEDGKILVCGYSVSSADVYNFTVVRLMGDTQTEIPAVDVTFANVETNSLDVTITPNAVCDSFYFVIMTSADMQQWMPMFGSEAGVIKTFGIHASGTLTHHFTTLTPNTEYYVYTVSVGFDGFEAPFQADFVQTAVAGGSGVAIATIELSEITQTSVRMIVTPNSETAFFHDGLITKAYFDEIGEAAAIEYFQNDGQPQYEIDNWVWIELEPNTAYKAISIAQNANGEWGPATIEDFTTLVTSINSIETNPLVVFPNPSQGQFQIASEDFQGANLKIIDMTGKTIYSAEIVNTLTSIDISANEAGLYFIEIEKDGVRSTSKFLKQ